MNNMISEIVNISESQLEDSLKNAYLQIQIELSSKHGENLIYALDQIKSNLNEDNKYIVDYLLDAANHIFLRCQNDRVELEDIAKRAKKSASDNFLNYKSPATSLEQGHSMCETCRSQSTQD